MNEIKISLQELLDMTTLEFSRLPEASVTDILENMEIELDRLRVTENKPKNMKLRECLQTLINTDQEDWNELPKRQVNKILLHLEKLSDQENSRSVKL